MALVLRLRMLPTHMNIANVTAARMTFPTMTSTKAFGMAAKLPSQVSSGKMLTA